MTDSKRAYLLEDSYDRDAPDSERQLVWAEGACLIDLFLRREWEALYSTARKLFALTARPAEKAFIVQWAVAGAEVECNPPERESALRLWNSIPSWSLDPYCRYLRAYHQGVSHFMACSLREADSCFQQAYETATLHGYERGRMRALFHLGLVEFDRGNAIMATRYLKEAEKLAVAREAARFLPRIRSMLTEIGSEERDRSGESGEFSQGKDEIEALILSKDFEGARERLLLLEALRRKNRLGRRWESLGMYLGLIACGRGRSELGRRLLSKIQDQVLKTKTLKLKAAALGLLPEEERELDFLTRCLGISRVVYRDARDPTTVEIAGVRLTTIRDGTVRELILLMLTRGKPVDKEEILRSIWRLEYDPVIHDQKVYQLIRKAKRCFGTSELFLNTYGAYEINPAFLGRAQGGGLSSASSAVNSRTGS